MENWEAMSRGVEFHIAQTANEPLSPYRPPPASHVSPADRHPYPVEHLLEERILVLDSAMGTMVRPNSGGTSAARNCRPSGPAGCIDVLSITQPEAIERIRRPISGRRGIIETNTFNSNAISMTDYQLQGHVREINLAASPARAVRP
jgi:methionine synthase I (cobalamin-dependent)